MFNFVWYLDFDFSQSPFNIIRDLQARGCWQDNAFNNLVCIKAWRYNYMVTADEHKDKNWW